MEFVAQIILADVSNLVRRKLKNLRVLVSSSMPKIGVAGDRCNDQCQINKGTENTMF
jgi:hypothetical protein